jgi:hypothetical protein
MSGSNAWQNAGIRRGYSGKFTFFKNALKRGSCSRLFKVGSPAFGGCDGNQRPRRHDQKFVLKASP